jgi:hypothetical protein
MKVDKRAIQKLAKNVHEQISCQLGLQLQ